MRKHQHNKYLGEIAKKVLDKTSSAVEQQFLDQYYDSFNKLPNPPESMDSAGQDILEQEILAGIHHKIHKPSANKPSIRLLIRISAAAALVLISGFGLYTYLNYGHKPAPAPDQLLVQDIHPGKNKAILTLPNGHQIALDSTGKALYSHLKVEEEQIAPGKLTYNTVSTPMGGQYQMVLPDGTKVWLNAASSLQFPSHFTKTAREVSLSGEGYFEVTYNPSSPFIVKSRGQEVKVLGTHFNINSYPDERTVKTTLLTGSVLVSAPANSKQSLVLKPGQQALNDNEIITMKPADLESVTAWKNNEFILRNEDFRATMRKIARWYNIEIVYAGDIPDDLELGGWVSRSKNIAAVLKHIEMTGKVHFKIEGRRVTVSR